ncbi:HhoA/HhoB/HtrA family serine endopeptidase [Leptolyngbya sp. PCC 6406]|uniref:HhoA/HhoB/HtrA family serine endopeptidase n=1 Tax=Leptolyngbya sp. PCC 6406 TaxID=1173264 RepID=UPI0002ABD8F5|nr:HhoA/HhoB/HtrA family serine endopeptidase [Leptolyngbya sp. PCC 6406]
MVISKLISGYGLWQPLLRQLLLGILLVVLVFTNGLAPAWAQDTAPTPSEPAAALVPAQSFVAVAVQQVGPAVVRIDTEKTVVRENLDPLFNDPFFRGFFGGPDGFPRTPQQELLRGQGSGFITTPEGDILTNAHVVNGADRVTVTLKDGRTFEGTVEGVDEVTDLAVIKIDAADEALPIAPLGNSDGVQVGDWAIAVGNPLGLDNTVTLGIISTLKRSSAAVGIPDKRLEFIQTDAAINPGNSGGPLLNQAGEVIGINTAIRADAMGIGFAIPINKAKEIKDQLARGEAIAHPYLGVQIASLTPDIAQRSNEDPNAGMMLPEVTGALVVRVVPDTPAAMAGLRRGDVIIRVDDQPVASADALQTLVENSRVGQTLRLTVKRGDQTQQLRVNTAELHSED